MSLEAKVRSDIAQIRFGQGISVDDAVDILEPYFTESETSVSAGPALKLLYELLRSEKVLSRALFDRLVLRHNEWVSSPTRDQVPLVPACCCCGFEPGMDQPEPLTVSAVPADASDLKKFLSDTTRSLASPTLFRNTKDSIPPEGLFELLTSPIEIDDEDQDKLYDLLQNNEILASGLFETGVAVARLGSFAGSSSSASPVVERISRSFRGDRDGGGGGGGGGGCCCCCCCCGGCCDCGGDC